MRLEEIQFEQDEATEYMTVRVPKRMKQEFEMYKQIYTKRQVAKWIRENLEKMLDEQRAFTACSK